MKVSGSEREVVIEPLTEENIPDVQSVERESYLAPWSSEGYIDEIRNRDSLGLVAKVDEMIVGFLVARLIMNSTCAEIYNVAVKEEFRRRQIASKLLNYLIRVCIENSLTEIWLEVRESNEPAILFYKQYGFRESYTRKRFYTNPDEDAIVMKKELREY